MLPATIVQQFALPRVHAVEPISGGLLHATYRLQTAAGAFAAQRLHDAIPDAALEDMRVVTAHLAARGMQVPTLRCTRDGQPYARDAHGQRWRVYPWLPGRVVEAIPHPAMAHEAGRLMGVLHRHLAALAYTPQGSIPHFHDTAHVVTTLAAVHGQLPDAARDMADNILETLPALIPAHVTHQLIHGDLKIANLLFDAAGQAVGLIDFDTLLLHARAIDLGDACRSWCNRSREDDPQACFDVAYCSAALHGYAAGYGRPLTPEDTAAYLAATKQITLELAARFLIDVVQDTYFGFDPSRYPSRQAHNLARARGQYHLAQTIPLPAGSLGCATILGLS